MLIVNKEQMSPADVLAKFGITDVLLGKLQKHSVFDITEHRKTMDMGTKRMKHGFGLEFPAHFFVKDEKGNTVEIRFATSVSTKNLENRSVDNYEPRSVRFMGEAEQKTDIDEAVYLYLHPKNASSPFRATGNYTSLPDYIYDDKQAKAQTKLKEMDMLTEALVHARNVVGEEMEIFARGMGISNVENIGEDEVRSQLAQLAQQDPYNYLRKKDSRVTEFEGKVYHAIEKGIFVIQDTFGNKRWVWGVGKEKGRSIVDINVAESDVTGVLMTHLKDNIADYYDAIDNAKKSVNAESKAEAFLSSMKAEKSGGKTKSYATNDILPDDFEGAKELFNKYTGTKAPGLVSKFWNEIKAGTIDNENMKERCEAIMRDNI